MNKLLVKIYGVIPKALRLKLGQSQFFKGFRRHLLYNSEGFKYAQVLVNRNYGGFKLNFQFVASIKTATKAKNEGIENTVLRNSFALIEQYKPNRTDLTVLDIGANFGYLASVWAHSIASTGQTIAFEPNKNLFACVKKTIAANNIKNFDVCNLAVGAHNGNIRLNVSDFSSNTNTLSSAIDTYNIDMVTVDDFVSNNKIHTVDLIKIDVDGIELDILKGAKEVLKQHTAIVIIETNNDKRIIEFFKLLNYTIYDMKLDLYKDGDVLPLNIFCVPKTQNN